MGMTDELNFNLEVYFFLSIFFLPQSALKHSFLGAESSNFAMNGPKNLSKSLYQKDRPFRAILDFAEKFQIFGILRLPNKFEDLKISSHFILLLNTSSKTICSKKIFGPISVEICCPEKMALNAFDLGISKYSSLLKYVYDECVGYVSIVLVLYLISKY